MLNQLHCCGPEVRLSMWWSNAAHLMVDKKQRGREKKPVAKYILIGHNPSDVLPTIKPVSSPSNASPGFYWWIHLPLITSSPSDAKQCPNTGVCEQYLRFKRHCYNIWSVFNKKLWDPQRSRKAKGVENQSPQKTGLGESRYWNGRQNITCCKHVLLKH